MRVRHRQCSTGPITPLGHWGVAVLLIVRVPRSGKHPVPGPANGRRGSSRRSRARGGRRALRARRRGRCRRTPCGCIVSSGSPLRCRSAAAPFGRQPDGLRCAGARRGCGCRRRRRCSYSPVSVRSIAPRSTTSAGMTLAISASGWSPTSRSRSSRQTGARLDLEARERSARRRRRARATEHRGLRVLPAPAPGRR